MLKTCAYLILLKNRCFRDPAEKSVVDLEAFRQGNLQRVGVSQQSPTHNRSRFSTSPIRSPPSYSQTTVQRTHAQRRHPAQTTRSGHSSDGPPAPAPLAAVLDKQEVKIAFWRVKDIKGRTGILGCSDAAKILKAADGMLSPQTNVNLRLVSCEGLMFIHEQMGQYFMGTEHRRQFKQAVGVEFGGAIFKKGVIFGFTLPEEGDATGSNSDVSVPAGTTRVGTYHTHPDNNNNAENFSPQDVMIARGVKAGQKVIRPPLLSYLGTPNGKIKKLTPPELLSAVDRNQSGVFGEQDVLR